jgi:hypothetical protein
MYLNYKNVSVVYDLEKHGFSASWSPSEGGGELPLIRDASVFYASYAGKRSAPSAFKKVEASVHHALENHTLSVRFGDGPDGASFELHFILDAAGLTVRTSARGHVHAEGMLHWGETPRVSTFGVRLDPDSQDLRSACGPAFSIHDNALFDRQTDRALEFKAPETFRVSFDWQADAYRFAFVSGADFSRQFSFKIHESYFKRTFQIPYAPIRKTHGFATPPVGWMTWYSLQFETNAERVIENAEAMVALLGKYDDKICLWVDWEWNHDGFTGLGETGVDTFTPRKKPYPDGLAPVAEKIKKLGLIPALWIGATNDGQKNRMMQAHPEWVLANKPTWCGQWWIDPTHPGVLEEYIPAVFRQVLDWGYQVIKWDCLPATFGVCDAFHEKFHDPRVTTDEAMRALVKAARKTIGPDVYLLSCSGETERDIGFATDLFSAARIGGDIFGWGDFVGNSLARVMRFFPLHNMAYYADADCLVLRPEFNTLAQARSRLSFYALAGLPLTLGDPLSTLDEPRREMLKRIVPVCDIHPMDLRPKTLGNVVILNHAVAKPFGAWNVVSLTNLREEPRELDLSLEGDLHIETRGKAGVVIYDFWNGAFLGCFGDRFQIRLAPMDTAVLRLTPIENHPQVISTSRHITQGGYDLDALSWDEKTNRLAGTSRVVAGDPYRIAIRVPQGFENPRVSCVEAVSHLRDGEILNIVITPNKGGTVDWSVEFPRAG